MTEKENSKQYDLEDRTLAFARKVRGFVKLLNRNIANMEDAKQLVRSSGSVGANYIEAKESKYWLQLIDVDGNSELENERSILENEAQELTYIFGSIVTKCQ